MVRPFQGGVVRLQFSCHIPNHGKSSRFQTYASARRNTGEKATKNSSWRCLSPRCEVYSLAAGEELRVRRSGTPPAERGAIGQSNSAPCFRCMLAPKSTSETLDRVTEARSCV